MNEQLHRLENRMPANTRGRCFSAEPKLHQNTNTHKSEQKNTVTVLHKSVIKMIQDGRVPRLVCNDTFPFSNAI